ncbi:MAG: penicillin-binding protein 2 [Desulfobacteraceae bacterium]
MVRTYLESTDSDWFNQRLTILLIFVFSVFAVLVARLVYLQVIEGKEYRRLSEINSIRLQDIDAPRGLMFDRHGKLLVDNRPSFNLHIILKDAKPLDETISKLSRVTGESIEDLEAQIEKNKRQGPYTPILLKEDMGRDLLAAIEVDKYDLPGVVVRVSPRRHYLFTRSAAHMIGYVGEISAGELKLKEYADLKGGDYIGKFGIEKSFETSLRGKRGGKQVEVNANGQVVNVLNTVAAQAGHNIILTIDHQLQTVAEGLLADKSGAVVAMDPNNGEILAMASSPTFDPNWFVVGMTPEQWNGIVANPFRPLENKAIKAEYPPASTYKIVTALAGLEEGVIDANTTFFCPGFYKYGNRIYRCWRRGGHGEVNVVKAIEQSCDVFFYQVGEALGVDRLAKFAKASGLGRRSGVDLDQESDGLVPTKAWKRKRFGTAWQGGETISVSIGQGFNLVTPLQMAKLMAAVANGGTLFKPNLIKSMQSLQDERVVDTVPTMEGNLPVKPENLALVKKGLWSVVNNRRGTAHSSRLKTIEFAGKTGTAQVVGRKTVEGLEEDQIKLMHRDHAWFVAYAPAENPRIAIAVIVEHGEHGSSAAAPIAKALIVAYLNIGEAEAASAGGGQGARAGGPRAETPQKDAVIETPEREDTAPAGGEQIPND